MPNCLVQPNFSCLIQISIPLPSQKPHTLLYKHTKWKVRCCVATIKNIFPVIFDSVLADIPVVLHTSLNLVFSRGCPDPFCFFVCPRDPHCTTTKKEPKGRVPFHFIEWALQHFNCSLHMQNILGNTYWERNGLMLRHCFHCLQFYEVHFHDVHLINFSTNYDQEEKYKDAAILIIFWNICTSLIVFLV